MARSAKRAISTAQKRMAAGVKNIVNETKETVEKAVKPVEPKTQDPKVSLTIELFGKKYNEEEIVKTAMEQYQKDHPENKIETFDIYFVADEQAAYYVVNGEGRPDYKVQF